MKVVYKYTFLFVGILLTFIFVYWLKANMGINIFSALSLSNHFPFKYLVNDVIEPSRTGILFSENFDDKRLFRLFSDFHLDRNQSVKQKLSPHGMNNSKCLMIISTIDSEWSYNYKKKVKVTKGDLFQIEGMIKITGEKLSTYLSINGYDYEKKVKKWDLSFTGTKKLGEWIKVEKQFRITNDNIKFIGFRIVGKGSGIYSFDNLVFRKELS